MNDYLWDKSGERDADVERLEDLLGQLRYEKKPLQLPPEAVLHRTARRPFWPALAAAAALAFVALAGLWFGLLRTQNQNANQALTAQTTNDATPENAKATTLTRTPDEAAITNRTIADAATVKQPGAKVAHVESQRKFRPTTTERALAARRREHVDANSEANQTGRRQEVARKVVRPREVQQELQAVNATAAEQQAAKEQLMLALRLTSAKLSLVQKKTHTTNGIKPAPDEQNKLR
jgi:hypothetical protein